MGIQRRLVGSYLVVILITVTILELFLIFSVRSYYYRNVERALVSQAELSASFFQQYFTAEDLDKQSERLLNGFAQHSNAQVQIIGAEGNLLQDSAGGQTGREMSTFEDVREARSGKVGIWKGLEPATYESVLAVSYPLQSDDKTVGIVRYVTSLSATKKTVGRISEILIMTGLIVVAIVTAVGIFLSRTITSSVKELKLAAQQMSEGDFSARAKKRYRDELGTLADTLNTMAVKIQQNEALKNDFIASVSHELRTPLTSIKGWAVTLRSNHEENKAMLADGMEIIEAETDRLTRLVDELLDFAQWDQGQIELHRTLLQFPDFLRHIVKQLTPRATRQGITLEAHIEEPLPAVHVDENRLKQVLINLLDNALKFTETGGSIRVTALSVKEGVAVSVADTGTGIAEHDIAHVFQKFYKGKGTGQGSGLGLAISKEIVERHCGTLMIASRVGEGTKVTIIIPV